VADNFKPAPGAIPRAQATTLAHTGTRHGSNFLEALADVFDVDRMNECMDAAAYQFTGVVAQGIPESFIGE